MHWNYPTMHGDELSQVVVNSGGKRIPSVGEILQQTSPTELYTSYPETNQMPGLTFSDQFTRIHTQCGCALSRQLATVNCSFVRNTFFFPEILIAQITQDLPTHTKIWHTPMQLWLCEQKIGKYPTTKHVACTSCRWNVPCGKWASLATLAFFFTQIRSIFVQFCLAELGFRARLLGENAGTKRHRGKATSCVWPYVRTGHFPLFNLRGAEERHSATHFRQGQLHLSFFTGLLFVNKIPVSFGEKTSLHLACKIENFPLKKRHDANFQVKQQVDLNYGECLWGRFTPTVSIKIKVLISVSVHFWAIIMLLMSVSSTGVEVG